jgi:hypothetical protein
MSTAELATSYAALILADDGVEITVRKMPTTSRETSCVANETSDDGRFELGTGATGLEHVD